MPNPNWGAGWQPNANTAPVNPAADDMRRRFFWVAGLAFMLVICLVVVGGTVAVLVISHSVGWIDLDDVLRQILRPPVAPRPPFGARPIQPVRLFWAVTAIIFIVFLITRTLQRFTHPLGDMISALTRMQSGDYAVRVAERGPRVMRTLTRSFNTMAARLQANDESRRAMLADVTHELRTPLTVIRGNLEGLLDGIYPRDDAHLKPLLEETHTMSRLVDDLRTLALAEGGALQLEREPTDLAWLAKDVLASLRAKADEAEVHLELHAPASLPQVEVDPVRIREVMMNLVSNALRYTPANGTIAVSFEASPSHIKTTVRDTGKGIAPEVLPHVFDRFYKSRDSSGSGLGLAIARQLVEAHGGSVAATSALGAGTQITFALPLNKAV